MAIGCGGEIDEALERDDGLAMAFGDESLLLEFLEHFLHPVTFLGPTIVWIGRCFWVRAWLNDGQNAKLEPGRAKPVAIINLAGQATPWACARLSDVSAGFP